MKSKPKGKEQTANGKRRHAPHSPSDNEPPTIDDGRESKPKGKGQRANGKKNDLSWGPGLSGPPPY
jgi:hypothetical protein